MELPTVFIATYRSYQAITKNIYDYLTKQGFEVLYHFSDDIRVDYSATIEPHILANAVVITTITPEGLQINHATNHYKLMLNTAIEEQRAIVPLMFFEDSWETELIQEVLPEHWQSLTNFAPIHLNFADFNSTVKMIEERLLKVDMSSIDINPTDEQLALFSIELDNLESALKAEEAYEKGGRCYLDKNYEKAEKYLTKAIELSPIFSDAYNNRALVNKHLGNSGFARKDIEQAIAINNATNSLNFVNYSVILMAESKHSDLTIIDEATDAAHQSIETDSNNSSGYNMLGNIYSYLGDYVEAVNFYTRSIEINPLNDVLFDNRAKTYEELEQFEDALKDYSRAYELKPEKHEYLKNRARVALHTNKVEQALSDFKMLLKLQPDSFGSNFWLAQTYLTIHQYDTALKLINQAIEIKPDSTIAYDRRGFIYQALGRSDLALIDCDTILEIDPNYAQAYFSKACIIAMSGNPDVAFKNFHQAISLEPENGRYYSSRADLHSLQKNQRAALVDLNMAIRFDPSASNYLSRGSTHMLLGNLSLARQDFERVLELDPKSKDVLDKFKLLETIENNTLNKGCWGILSQIVLF